MNITDTYDLVTDFSSKGGPSDLHGVYTPRSPFGYITWEDGNVWTQLTYESSSVELGRRPAATKQPVSPQKDSTREIHVWRKQERKKDLFLTQLTDLEFNIYYRISRQNPDFDYI